MLRDSPPSTIPPPPPSLCKSLLVNSHFTAYPGCVQASNATANSTLNSFRFKSYDLLLLLIITSLGLIKHTLTPTLTLTLTYHLPLPIRQSVQKICDEVRKKQLDRKILCNQQRIRNDSIEQGRMLRYNRLRAGGDDEVEDETEGKIHDVAKLLRSGRLILGTIGLHVRLHSRLLGCFGVFYAQAMVDFPLILDSASCRLEVLTALRLLMAWETVRRSCRPILRSRLPRGLEA